MTDAAPIALDPEQELVARSDPDKRLFVIAGPGSGKTETVTARVRHLVEEQELGPESLWIISFSRAAVEAMHRRARTSGSSHAGWVTTLDSLTARILSDLGADLEGLGFDARIRALLKTLDAGDAVDALDGVEHIIVDEVQDIVGDRAELLLAILGRLPDASGFTLLGDPLQGIYDFQLAKRVTASPSLRDAATTLGAEVVELKGQYRAATPDAVQAMAIRNRGSVGSWTVEMDDFVQSMAQLPVDQIGEWLTRTPGTVAILTQSNAQALTLSNDLYEQGVAAELLGPSHHRPIAPWIARTLGDLDRPIERAQFIDRMTDTDEDIAVERWLDLRRLVRSNQRTLDMRAVATRLASGIVPVNLLRARSRVTISTVHRAKGLEFDRVLLLSPEDWYREDQDAFARTLYVAMTRPRTRLTTFRAPKTSLGWKVEDFLDRAVQTPFRKRGIIGFEIRGSDWRSPQPPDADGDPLRVQELLGKLTQEDAPRAVDIEFDPYHSTSMHPVYQARLDGVLIGSTGAALAEDLYKRAGRNDRWPALDNLFLVGAETVAGPAQSGPVGKNGLWLSPLIIGPAHLTWRR